MDSVGEWNCPDVLVFAPKLDRAGEKGVPPPRVIFPIGPVHVRGQIQYFPVPDQIGPWQAGRIGGIRRGAFHEANTNLVHDTGIAIEIDLDIRPQCFELPHGFLKEFHPITSLKNGNLNFDPGSDP